MRLGPLDESAVQERVDCAQGLDEREVTRQIEAGSQWRRGRELADHLDIAGP